MTDRQLKDRAIKFKGSDYVQVKDRINYLAENYEGQYMIETSYNYFPDEKMRVVRATLTIGTCRYTGLAQEIEGQGYINKTSALENAETSAVGRACAMAGIGVIDSIASMDEINKANNRADTPYTKPSFGEKEFLNLQRDKDKYTFDEVFKTIQEKYRLGNDYSQKIMELYGKDAGDLF